MKIPFTNFALNIARNQTPRGHFSQGGDVSLAGLLRYEGVRVAPKDLWQIFRQNADVYSCIREWKQSIGGGGFRFTDTRDPEMDAPISEVKFLGQFFRNSGGLVKIQNNIARDCGISGNAYFEIVNARSGKPYGLKRLDPRSMYIVADKHGQIIKYLQKIYGEATVEFMPEEILHIVLDDDPDNELLGMSPLETALWEARTDISASQSNYYFFENDAVPSNVYVIDKTLPIAVQEKLVEDIKAQFSGAKNKHKSAVLAGVEEIKTISMSPKEMDFVLGRKFNTDKVCSVYGVPKFMLGYSDQVNYSNSMSLRADFYAGTVKPLEKMISDAFTEDLFKKIGITRTIFEYNPQSFGEELEGSRFALSELQAGVLTLRQYKSKTGQQITTEDEQDPMIDSHIIHNGGGARLLEDVGVEPVVDPTDPSLAENMIKALKSKFTHEDN